MTSSDANKRGVRSVFLPAAIVLGRKPSSNLRRIHSGRAMATALASRISTATLSAGAERRRAPLSLKASATQIRVIARRAIE